MLKIIYNKNANFSEHVVKIYIKNAKNFSKQIYIKNAKNFLTMLWKFYVKNAENFF